MVSIVQTLRDFNYSVEQIELLLNAKAGTFGANFLVPIIFFALYSLFIPFLYLFIWLSLQLIVFFIRIWISKKGLEAIDKSDNKEIQKYFIAYLGMIFLNALLWGMVSIFVLEYCDQTFFFIYIIMLSGLVAAGASSIGVVFHAITIFLVNVVIISSLIGFYYGGSSVVYLLSSFMLIYFFFMFMVSFRNHSFIVENIEQKEQIIKSHNLIKESIEYAALIQRAMLPKEKILESYFEDYFVYFKQRDVVGGDFYSVIPLGKDELLVMVLDGVGHGVSGAFMTMLIKATEHQIVTEIHHEMLEPSPALILSRFNVLIKSMTEEQCDTRAMIGFDGGILYFNKKTSLVRYSGAKMPLYMIENGVLEVYKGARKSIGFVRTPMKQVFQEYEFILTSKNKFYIVTDGIFDQEGKDGMRFGEKRFGALLLEHHNKTFTTQYEIFDNEIKTFMGTKKQVDDSTIVGFSLNLKH